MMLGPFLLSALLTQAKDIPAPAPRRRVYAYGSGMLSHHPANGASYHRVEPNLGGQTWTIVAGAGGFLTPSIGLEGEFVLGGMIAAPQVFSYELRTNYVAQNRDILIDEMIRFRRSERSLWQFVAGGGFARTRTNTVDTVVTDFTGKKTTIANPPPTDYNGVTLTGGVDGRVPSGEHAAIGPTVRVRWVHRPAAAADGWNGIGNLAFQFGASVLFR
jgi:hypothetical protein